MNRVRNARGDVVKRSENPDREENSLNHRKVEPCLDPDDWEEMRALGHRMVDDVIEHLRTVRQRPVWQSIPSIVRKRFREPLPLAPQGAEAAYEAFLTDVLPYPRGNIHPRFWGWVNGSGLPLGVFADFLAAAMNCSVGAFENAATMVEEQVLDWLKEMLGFPRESSALLTSGCSMSNIISLAVARSAHAKADVRRLGMAAVPGIMTIYCSAETHSSIQKAVELLGIGNELLRRIPVSCDYRIKLSELKQKILEDRRAGMQPFCIIGNAGTVNTGAIDDLSQLAELCKREQLWFHVDGAFGAMAWLCPEKRSVLGGLQEADSLAFDLHKWMYLPYDVGCVFVRNSRVHYDTFSLTPAYLSPTAGGPADYPTSFPDYGIELSRRFRALKVWLCLKEHGIEKFARQIRHNMHQATYLVERIRSSPQLQLVAASLNVVCFRMVWDDLDSLTLNALNEEALVRLQRGGVAVPSHTILEEKFVIRVALTNHRSRIDDFDLFIDELLRLGSQLHQEFKRRGHDLRGV